MHKTWPALLVLAIAGGCQSMNVGGVFPWAKDGEEEKSRYPTPVRMATTWTDGTYYQTGEPATRRQGLATHLLGESFQRLRTQGIVRVGAQTMQANEPALALYAKLGFNKVDEGVVFRKGD